MPKLHSNLRVRIGDAGSGQRTDQHDVDAGRDEARFERRFEHVARQSGVLADEDGAAVRRKHARRRARQSQREIHRHRMFADPTADAVGAEILTCHRNSLPATTAAATRIASTVAATSWARTIRAPLRTAMAASAMLPAVRSSTSRPVIFASIDLRDSPTASGTPSSRNCPRCLSNARLSTMRFAKTEAGIDGESCALDACRHGTPRHAQRETR